MSTYRLDKLFSPRSVAVVGASPRATSPGRAVIAQPSHRRLQGPIHLVNPHYAEIEGLAIRQEHCSELPSRAGFARHRGAAGGACPSIVAAAGEKGAAAGNRDHRRARPWRGLARRRLREGRAGNRPAARWPQLPWRAWCRAPASMRASRPACRRSGRSRAHLAIGRDCRRIGRMGGACTTSAFPRSSRSATRSTSISATCSIFSRSIGSTRAILLYVESINDARKFMSAARAAARIKPVVVVKAGRHAQGAKAAQTHTGALAGSDAVYDAAFRRAGLLRVLDLDELFAAAETLGRLKPFPGKRLAILTNGGGIGVLAVDRLADLGGDAGRNFARNACSSSTRCCRRSGRQANPVDIAGDADAARYAAALEALLADPDNDAVLGDECSDRARFAGTRGEAGRRRRAIASQPPAAAEAGICRMGRRAATRQRTLRSSRHPQLCDRSRRGCAASCISCATGEALRCVDGDAAEPAAGFRARLSRPRARRRRRSAASDGRSTLA